MTLEEAKKLAYVFAHADGGCYSCARIQCEMANELNLGFKWEFGKAKYSDLYEEYDPAKSYGVIVSEVV